MRTINRLRRIAVLLVLTISGSAASAETVLVTGANRGIGLEFVKQYAGLGWQVIATHRRQDLPESLAAAQQRYPGLITVATMDVTDQLQIESVSQRFKDTPIDVLINNAAIIGRDYGDQQQFGTLNFDLFDLFMRTNVQGPLSISEAFMGQVLKSDGKSIVAISSMAGSLSNSWKATPNRVFYKTSKAALNMAMTRIAAATREKGVRVAIISPGLVRTEALADIESPLFIEPEESVANMIRVIDGLESMESGQFWNHTGEPLPW